MVEVKILAAMLLFLRLVSVLFLSFVLKKQIRLLRDTRTEFSSIRIVLTALVSITFIGNFVPIAIDINTLFREIGGSPETLLTAYAISNALTSVSAAIGWWVLYRMIEKEQKALSD